jgi:hypothetical protein
MFLHYSIEGILVCFIAGREVTDWMQQSTES